MHCDACDKVFLDQKVEELEDMCINFYRPPPSPKADECDKMGGPGGSGQGHGYGDLNKSSPAISGEVVILPCVYYGDHGEISMM